MAVKIRMKQMGRRHRPFFRICAIDGRAPRDGKVIEELGHYDPLVRETDARVLLNGDRVDYWLSVGAQPTEKVAVLIKKYGTNGTHKEAQKAALDRLAIRPQAPPPVKLELKLPQQAVAEESAAEGEGGAESEG
ncbi:MAG: 30S ribosomal protein S16 [Pirellulales bacterium]